MDFGELIFILIVFGIIVTIVATAIGTSDGDENRMKKMTAVILNIIVLTLSLSTFILGSISLYQKYKTSDKGFWDAATSSFTLLGGLIAIGTAFAAIVGIMSYFSLNQKLDQANKELEKSNDLLSQAGTKISEAETKLCEANAKFDEADKKLREANTRFEKADTKLYEANTKLYEADRQLNKVNSTFNEAAKKLNEANAKFNEADEKLSEANKMLAKTTALKAEQDKLIYSTKKLDEYLSFLANSKDNPKNKDIFKQASELANEELLPFYGRLKVNAILNDKDARDTYNQAKQFSGEKAEEIWKKTYFLYQKSAEYWKLLYLNDKLSYSLENYTTSLFNSAYSLDKINEKDYDKIIFLYKEIIQIREHNGLEQYKESFNNLGSTLLDRAKLTENKTEKRNLLDQATLNYEKAISINKNYADGFNGLANVLLVKASIIKDEKEKLGLLDQAISNYEKAIGINKNHPYYFNGLASAQGYKAYFIKDKQEKLDLLKQAISNYKITIELDNNYIDPYKNSKITINNALKLLKENNALLQSFLQHTQSALNQIKDLKRNAECEAKFKEIVELVESKLKELNGKASSSAK